MAQCAVPVSISVHSPSTHRILVGRERELGELGGALEEVLSGRGTVLLATGEPGIGKTRLADELGRKAASRGFHVHWGRAWEAGGAPSYWMFIQALRSLCRSTERERLASWIGLRGSELAGLLRRGGQRFEPSPDEGSLEALREAWHVAVRRALLH